MAPYVVNKLAVAHARRLIDAHQYVLDSDWGESQPSPDDENTFLESHPWEEFAQWHLGLADLDRVADANTARPLALDRGGRRHGWKRARPRLALSRRAV